MVRPAVLGISTGAVRFIRRGEAVYVLIVSYYGEPLEGDWLSTPSSTHGPITRHVQHMGGNHPHPRGDLQGVRGGTAEAAGATQESSPSHA